MSKAESTGRNAVWTKALLSLFIVYHLCTVFLSPNKTSYASYRFAKYFAPYGDTFELSSTWSFFAPDPGIPIYLEYELFDKEGHSLRRSFWPELQNPYFFRDRFNRYVSAERFLMTQDGAVSKTLVPYLCQTEAGVNSVKITKVTDTVPGILDVASGKKQIGSEANRDRKVVTLDFCEGGAKT